jgi:hypothetical protein
VGIPQDLHSRIVQAFYPAYTGTANHDKLKRLISSSCALLHGDGVGVASRLGREEGRADHGQHAGLAVGEVDGGATLAIDRRSF